jgi:hypothetical protein
MSQLEVIAYPGKSTLVAQCYDLAGSTVGSTFNLTEGPAGRYRGSTIVTGTRYIVITGTNLTVVGYSDLDTVDSNGYSKLCETFEEAESQWLTILNNIYVLANTGQLYQPKPPSTGNLIYHNNETGVTYTVGSADYTSVSIKVHIETPDKTDIATIANADITKTSSSIGFALPSYVLQNIGNYRMSVRRTSDDFLLATGVIQGYYAPFTPL